MVLIDSYNFGQMVIEGKSYHKDVIIYPDESILCPWWRESGHVLKRADIRSLIELRPEIIIAGTGSPGLMKPDEDLQKFLQGEGIEFIAQPTKKAVQLYNEQAKTKRIGGCFHLTC